MIRSLGEEGKLVFRIYMCVQCSVVTGDSLLIVCHYSAVLLLTAGALNSGVSGICGPKCSVPLSIILCILTCPLYSLSFRDVH